MKPATLYFAFCVASLAGLGAAISCLSHEVSFPDGGGGSTGVGVGGAPVTASASSTSTSKTSTTSGADGSTGHTSSAVSSSSGGGGGVGGAKTTTATVTSASVTIAAASSTATTTSSSTGTTCVPLKSCAKGQCDTMGDGCGGIIDCGSCPAGANEGCGVGGVPNECAAVTYTYCESPDGGGGECPPGFTNIGQWSTPVECGAADGTCDTSDAPVEMIVCIREAPSVHYDCDYTTACSGNLNNLVQIVYTCDCYNESSVGLYVCADL
jgi:hypothetical protein